MAYKVKSWPHGLISVIVMAIFYFIVPELPKIVYAALIPVVYFYGREVRDAESYNGMTTIKYLNPLWPPNWQDKDNRNDFYVPLVVVAAISYLITGFKLTPVF